MSETYSDFARVYDTFMCNTPYREWCDNLCKLIEQYGIFYPEKSIKGSVQEKKCAPNTGTISSEETEKEGRSDSLQENLQAEKSTILDLGCGTGILTEMMAERGFHMIGVDNSEEMLGIALERQALQKEENKGEAYGEENILYLLQDMREFELYGTVGAVISVCDSMNYLLEEADILETLKSVNNYLYPKGIFIFDFNTVHKYRDIIGDATIAENQEECSFIWENYYYLQEEVNEYDLTVFVKEEDGRYSKFCETHYQRGYTLKQMKHLVKEAGMEFVAALDVDTLGEVTENSERIYVVARECMKEDKQLRNS